MRWLWHVAILGGLSTIGCGQDQITPLPTAVVATTTPPVVDAAHPCPRVCAPGSTELCYCADTHQTAQVCAADGLSWEPCPCSGAKADAGAAQ